MVHKILELYSGIGGMHCAWNASELNGEIITAVDINTVANEVYKYNFPNTPLITKNIQSLSYEDIKKMNIYFEELDNIEYILMENVKGFECSTVRNLFINKLKKCNFVYQEFLLCPTSVGVPNSRLRYYCIARKNTSEWSFKRTDEIITKLPKEYGGPHTLEEILETNVPEKYLLTNNFLKRAYLLDICYKHSKRSCCFTKSYTHYVEGTGSVYTDSTPEEVENCIKEAKQYEVGKEEYVNRFQQLKLRFFTPKEVLALMMFPKSYKFPEKTTTKQCYRLLGNSVNVKVISELLKLLFE
ncbi:unnamed protein product [Danaus chrysippus]|uniref:tRNA (cytosine(38)-C(5))-methyltransferase n=1 Tax=Danaus chrysippus TaxID=151541 RepID=A0A8J2QF58_9NEOP|nr:unnamed protein product [Danaus chrysippus]